VRYCCDNNQRIGSCYFEFQKGKFDDKFWLDSSLCISDDTFEDLGLYHIFTEVIPEFDYYGVTEISKEKWELLKLSANKYNTAVQTVIAEIDSWAQATLPDEKIITVLGI